MRAIRDAFYISWLYLTGHSTSEVYEKVTGDNPDRLGPAGSEMYGP
jgi:hypothetical protein